MWRRDSAAPLPARKCCSPRHIKWLPLFGGCVGRQCNRADLMRAAAGGPASRPRCCWPLPASPRTRQRLLATRHSCERQAEGGNAVHAHRGGAVHTAGLSDAAGLWRDVEIESKAECGAEAVHMSGGCQSGAVSRFISPNKVTFTAAAARPLPSHEDRHERSEVRAAILHVQP